MPESQTIEYKESWRDECLKWLCGFANAQGGTLFVGLDDSGHVVGLPDAKRLLEDIPNKIRDGLGIVADVDLRSRDGLDYLEIRVAPSVFPVSFRGEYHYRSGATKQQLTGLALSLFILRKTGLRWEDATVEGVSPSDLDPDSFRIFRRAALRSRRMARAELDIPDAELLDKLHLLSDGRLKRSAVLLFHPDPSIVQNGICVQIGRFSSGPDLLYQDLLEGSLLSTADKVVDLLYLKYLKARVTYVHDRRVETYPFARDAVREAVFNAIVHADYMLGSPVQIRVEDEALVVSNPCVLPDGWTLETLLAPHESKPFNPDIANVFYRAGYIEHWGRGIAKILDACRDYGAPPPTWELIGTGLRVRFPAHPDALFPAQSVTKDHPDPLDDPLDDALENRLLALLAQNASLSQEALARATRVSVPSVKRAIRRLRDSGRLVRLGGKRFGRWQILPPP